MQLISILFAMKKTLFLSLMAIVAVLSSCSTRVDLYADYKDIPVVYGLLDYDIDTNYIRINRAFSSNNENPINAYEVALIADSCNYPGKLDARIIELQKGYGNQFHPTGTEFILDTMTIHNKQEGLFYSPDQKVYYTTEKFKRNTADYKYRLVVYKDKDTISSETGLVGGENFKITTSRLSFDPDDESTGKVNFAIADNAAMYEMTFQFTYKEIRHGDTVQKAINYNFGTGTLETLDHAESSTTVYYFPYPHRLLFSKLHDAIGNDTVGVVRHVGKCIITLAAGGDEMYNFIQVNTNGGGYSQTVPDYTNIKGGYGVFSSRLTIRRDDILLDRMTLAKLYGRFGFMQD